MQSLKSKNSYIIRLEKGEKIIEELTFFCAKENIYAGFFSAIGAVVSAEIAFYNLKSKNYSYKKIDKDHEIVGLTGNVSLVNSKPFIHAHCVLSGKDFKCVGGHLKEGVVGATCEIYLIKENVSLARKLDEKVGLNLLDCSA